MVTAGWRLLAGDCSLATPRLLFAQGKQKAGRGPGDSFKRVLGGLQEGSGMVSGGPRGSSGSHGELQEGLGRAEEAMMSQFYCLVSIWEALCRNVHQTFTTE